MNDRANSFTLSDALPSVAGEVGAASETSTSSSQINPNDTASGSIVKQRRTRSDKGQARGSKGGIGGSAGGLSAADVKAAEALFDEKQWRGIVALPADIGKAVTGSKRFELSEQETETLAVGAANTARYFATFHPKWLALTLFSLSLAQVYGTRIALYAADKKEEKKANAAKPVN